MSPLRMAAEATLGTWSFLYTLSVYCATVQDAVTLPGLDPTVAKTWVLASSKMVDFKQTSGKLTLQLPSDEDSLMPVIVVECEGNTIVVD